MNIYEKSYFLENAERVTKEIEEEMDMQMIKVEGIEIPRDKLVAALKAADDPYKKFKDALAAGKRVRHLNKVWKSETEGRPNFGWVKPPEEYEIEPEFCGYTEDQWQFVIDNEFLVSDSRGSGCYRLKELQIDNVGMPFFVTSFSLMGFGTHSVSIVREKGHKQPVFGKEVADDADVLSHNKYSDGYHAGKAGRVIWDDVDWFIEL